MKLQKDCKNIIVNVHDSDGKIIRMLAMPDAKFIVPGTQPRFPVWIKRAPCRV